MVLSATRRRDNNTRDMLSYRTSIRHGTKLFCIQPLKPSLLLSSRQWLQLNYLHPSLVPKRLCPAAFIFLFSFLPFIPLALLCGWVGGWVDSIHTDRQTHSCATRYIWFVSRKYNTVAAGSITHTHTTTTQSVGAVCEIAIIYQSL